MGLGAMLLPDACVLYSLPVIRGRRRGGRVREKEEEGEREKNFQCVEDVLDHADMWGDLEGLQNLLSAHEI